MVTCRTATIAQTPTVYPFPTSKPGYATVHGQIVLTNPLTVAPEHNGVYLVPLDQGTTDQSTIPVVVPGKSLQANVDETSGEFIILNVQPGHYQIVIRTEGGVQMPAHIYQNAEPATVLVNESDLNQTIEVGMIRVP